MEKDSKKTEIDRQLIKILARQFELMVNRGPVSDWSQRDFIALNEAIESKTHVQISVTTLKRIFGKVEYHGLPYVHTLNVLAQYLDYLHWADFKKKQLGDAYEEEEEPEMSGPEILKSVPKFQNGTRRRKRQPILLYSFILLGFFFFFAIGWYASWWFEKGRWQVPQTKNNIDSPGKLSAEILFPDSLPAEVKFIYQGPNGDPNDLTVITSHGGLLERFSVNQAGLGSKKITFPNPGIFPVRVFNNRRQLAYLPFLVPSKNWQTSLLFKHKRIELPHFNLTKGNSKIPLSQLLAAGVDTNLRFFSVFSRFKEFGLSGDSFVFNTQIRNPQSSLEFKDESSRIVIRCANNSIQIQLAKVLPRFGMAFQISDIYMERGNNKAESKFLISMDTWRQVKIKTRKNVCQVWIDEKLCLETAYTLPLGEIYGLEYQFTGSGEIKNYQFSDSRGKIWEEQF
jgi:hypothetical protein